MARIFDYQGYPTDPNDLSDRAWYYIQKEGIVVCQRIKGQPTETAIISWSRIKRAMRDHDAAAIRRPKKQR